MLMGDPGRIGVHRHRAHLAVEQKSTLAAVHMGVAAVAKIPHQRHDGIVPRLQEGSQIHLVIVGGDLLTHHVHIRLTGIGRAVYVLFQQGRTTLELALVHGHPAVYPQPVFGVRRDTGSHLTGQVSRGKGDILAQSHPAVTGTVIVCIPYPFGIAKDGRVGCLECICSGHINRLRIVWYGVGCTAN